MIIQLVDESNSLENGAKIVLAKKGHQIGEKGLTVVAKQINERRIQVVTTKEGYLVSYGEKAWFYRGLMELMRQLEEGRAEICFEEDAVFETNGMMIDCSRNAVPKVATIKAWIEKQAMLGLNRILLYMEDTYEIPEYPYFGYMRGRYTQEELRECDSYAQEFGIEMVPCIQTLGHLHTALKWEEFKQIKDTEDILFVGEEKTYVFLERAIEAVSTPFSSKKIHLGMDEAYGLGAGEYLRKNGYKDRTKIMNEHLEKVLAICEDKQLEPMIWSDMYFNQHSADGLYYEIEESADLSSWEKPPHNVGLVYWDYYHCGVEFYERFFQMHHKLAKKVLFAGGGWTWNGLAPNQSLARQTTLDALEASKKEGIKEVFCTFWGDNGSETPLEVGLPTVFLYGERGFCEVDENTDTISESDTFQKRFTYLFESDYEDYMVLEKFDTLDGTLPYNLGFDTPAKQMMYQDLLLGIFDKQIEENEIASQYEKLCKQLKENNKKNRSSTTGNQLLFDYYETLAHFLALKSELGLRIKKAYVHKEDKALREIASATIPKCVELLITLKNMREELWMTSNKPFGYETIDIRFGGTITRMESVKKRLDYYCEGKIDNIDELEVEKLLYAKPKENNHVHASCNRWEMIVTPGNIHGV